MQELQANVKKLLVICLVTLISSCAHIRDEKIRVPVTVGLVSIEDNGAWFYPEGQTSFFVPWEDLDKYLIFSPRDAEILATKIQQLKEIEKIP